MQVIAFIKRLHPDFPIRAPLTAHVAHHFHLVDVVGFKVALRQAYAPGKGRGVLIHRDKHDSCMYLAVHTCESRAMSDHLRLKGVFVGYPPQIPIIVEAPAMEGADENLLVTTLLPDQL